MSTSELTSTVEGNFTFLFKLSFISNEVDECVGRGVLLDFLEPVDSVHKSLISGNIVSQEYAVSSSVEDSSDTLERLLACSVPDLKLNNFVLDGTSERTELDSNGDLMFSLELVVLHSAHQATFANTCVTNYNQFE